MIPLKSLKYSCLNDFVVRNLAQNRINSILDFLQVDVEKLAAISKLPIQQLTSLRNDFLSNYSVQPINGSCFLQHTSNRYLSTHLKNLDILLGGGIPIGYITEVCGLADSGKTQLCIQTAVNISNDGNNSVLYIDTKGDFSAIRMQRILDAGGYSHKTMASIMYRIKVMHTWTMDELVNLICKIQDKSVSFENLSLIIIDSLPCLMLQFLGEDNKIGLTLLNKLVNHLRFLAKALHIGILCVNIQTRWVEQDLVEVEDTKSSSINTTSNVATTEKKNRCLGRYWHFIPAVVLLLERNANEHNISQINVSLARSLKVQNQNMCVLNMCNAGIK